MFPALAAAGVAAVATTRGWIDYGSESAAAVAAVAQVPDRAPVPAALAMAVLAGLGTVLVTRGVVRRALAAAATALALALLAVVAVSGGQLRDDARAGMVALGQSDQAISLNGWHGVALGSAALVAILAGVVVWACPQWPEMGKRYDSPVGQETTISTASVTSRSAGGEAGETAPGSAPETPEDWWRAIDAGHDPTDSRGHPQP